MTGRREVSPRLRFETLKRDGFACQYCGRKAPNVTLHVDHIIPVAKGGSNAAGNLITACEECNLGKNTTSIVPEDTTEQAKLKTSSVSEIVNVFAGVARIYLETWQFKPHPDPFAYNLIDNKMVNVWKRVFVMEVAGGVNIQLYEEMFQNVQENPHRYDAAILEIVKGYAESNDVVEKAAYVVALCYIHGANEVAEVCLKIIKGLPDNRHPLASFL